MKHNVPATACSGSLPHANSFYTIAHSVCSELMNVCLLFPVAPVGSMRAESLSILHIVEPGTQWLLTEHSVNDVCGHSSWPHPKVLPPLYP